MPDQQQRIADLGRRLAAAEGPDLNTPVIDLAPTDALRNAGGPPEFVRIPKSARRVVVVLSTSGGAPGALYDLDLVDRQGRLLWTGSGLVQSADGTLTLVLPRSLLAAAARIRLYASAPAPRRVVEEYVVPVREE
jgi:hypothetical protein